MWAYLADQVEELLCVLVCDVVRVHRPHAVFDLLHNYGSFLLLFLASFVLLVGQFSIDNWDLGPLLLFQICIHLSPLFEHTAHIGHLMVGVEQCSHSI